MKRNNLTKIIFVIVVLTIVYFVFFRNNNTQDNNYSNSYLENHSFSHVEDTNSSQLNTEVSLEAREKFTKIIGNNKDEVNVMIYIIGTDLESNYGAATADLNEMLYADINDNINIIIETGGCKNWRNSVISSRNIERYTINSQGLLRLNTNIKNAAMTQQETLTSFIKYSQENFPTANRNILILWDHGGGSVAGYGYDEKYPNVSSMSPDTIATAIRNSGVKFDIIGFDACLMANLETAIALEPYADYLIASEEVEPGEGWYYTNWLKAIDNNTSMPSIELGKIIIDDYVANSLKKNSRSEVTLSITDLGQLVSSVSKPLANFSRATTKQLNNENYQKIANARANTKEFSKSSHIDQVDLVDLAIKFNVDGSNDLAKAIKNSIKYNKTANVSDSYGMSVYFPFAALNKVNAMVKIHNNINMESEYTSAVTKFASYAASGQIVTNNTNSSSTSIFDILLGNNYYDSQDYSSDYLYDIFNNAYQQQDYDDYGYQDSFGSGYEQWFDYSSLDLLSSFFARNKNNVDMAKLKPTVKDGIKVLELSSQQWSMVDELTLNMFVDDGSGYIDLGRDNSFEFNRYGDLICQSDGTWLSINDHVVAYYLVSDTVFDNNRYKIVGKIPAYLNDERVDIIVNFTDLQPYGKVIGAKKIYDNDMQAKGLIEIKEGDKIDFVCNYYFYDGSFDNEYQLGDSLIVNGSLELNNIYLDNDYIYTYCIKDYYGNNMWTEKQEVRK